MQSFSSRETNVKFKRVANNLKKAFLTFSFLRSSSRTASISCRQSSCMMWKLSCGVCVNEEWTMLSKSSRISSNDGRLWGSDSQHSETTMQNLVIKVMYIDYFITVG